MVTQPLTSKELSAKAVKREKAKQREAIARTERVRKLGAKWLRGGIVLSFGRSQRCARGGEL